MLPLEKQNRNLNENANGKMATGNWRRFPFRISRKQLVCSLRSIAWIICECFNSAFDGSVCGCICMCVCVRGCCIFDIYVGKSISSPAVVDWNILNLYTYISRSRKSCWSNKILYDKLCIAMPYFNKYLTLILFMCTSVCESVSHI